MGVDSQAANRHAAGLKGFQAVETAEERALAAAGGPDDHGHLASAHGQGHAAKHLDRAMPLDQVADFDHATIPPFTPPEARRRSDHRENHDRGTLIIM